MGQKPRIYIAIASFYPRVGGAETQTLAQCQYLQAQGYDVQVVTFRHELTMRTEELVRGVPVKRIAGLLLGKRFKMPRVFSKLMYLLAMGEMGWTAWRDRKHYDVLQLCQFSLLSLPLGLACRLAGKPMTIVVISSGADKDRKTRSTGARLLAGPLDPHTPWLNVDGHTWIDGDLANIKSVGEPVVRFTRSLLKSIGAVVIVLSTRMQNYVKNNGFDLPGMQLVPNGVDTVRFHPAPANLTDAKRARTVVCVSKLRYEKGIDVLLQAWHLVHEQEPDARLIIVGDGPIQPHLQQMADALGITDSVEFAGLQSDVPAQLHRATINVLPSRWEGMPNALLEAMGSGLACVATRVSGSEDIIQSGVNGQLVEPEDYEGMAQALLQLLRDPALVQEYAQAARATIEQHYTLEQVINMYTTIYQRLTTPGGSLPGDASTNIVPDASTNTSSKAQPSASYPSAP